MAKKLDKLMESKNGISSGDLAAMQTEVATEMPADKLFVNAAQEPTTIPATDAPAEGEETYRSVAEKKDAEVYITPDDKFRFINSVVNGTRFTKRVALLGGRFTCVVQNRTVNDTEAWSSMRRVLALNNPAMHLDQFNGICRRWLYRMQVIEINGAKLEESKFKPEVTMKLVDGKHVTELSAWCDEADKFFSLPHQQLIEMAFVDFERTYWKLLEASADANFWNSVE